MRTDACWRHVAAVAALVCLAAGSAIAQPNGFSPGPTRIKIAAGMVSAEDTRAGLLGEWERDAELGPGVPPGSNRRIYLADGLYFNPFRNVALIGFWSATADVVTMTPFEIRQLATGVPAPELRDVGAIVWDKPTLTQITWLTPDRFQEKSEPEAQQRAQPLHDVTTVHRAAVMDLLRGSWIKPGGATVVFEADGTFREQLSSGLMKAVGDAAQTTVSGTYDFDAAAGLLRRNNTNVDAASLAVRMLQTGARTPSTLRWTSRDLVTADGEQWTRQSKAPDACPTCATGGRGFLGVGTPTSGAAIVSIVADSPAASLGLRPDDVIVGLDGTAVESGAALRSALATRKPGDRVELAVSREGGPTSSLTASLATGANGVGSLGVGLAPAGAIVTQVQSGSPAERAGLQVGDWIEAVNGSNIQDGADLVKTIQALAPGTDAVLTVVRNGTRIEQRVTIGKVPQ